MSGLRALLRRTWLCIELREHLHTPLCAETARVVSRHWTRRRALAAARLYAENWLNTRGEVKAGRARWDDVAGQVRRFSAGIRPEPNRRMAELARLPQISYFPMPIEELADASA